MRPYYLYNGNHLQVRRYLDIEVVPRCRPIFTHIHIFTNISGLLHWKSYHSASEVILGLHNQWDTIASERVLKYVGNTIISRDGLAH